MPAKIVVLGVFNADTTYRAERLPRIGETIHGLSFALGPGGKGSNQAVAAARAGGAVHFISRLGRDTFAGIARRVWADAGVVPEITEETEGQTGAALIFVETGTGDNAIVIAPGAAANISETDVEARRALIEGAAVFVTQLEQPLAAARLGLKIAKAAGVVTVFNPAPASALPGGMLADCDYVTPNETEAVILTGRPVGTLGEAEAAAGALLAAGAGAVALTLGAQGVLYRDAGRTAHIPAMAAGPVVETTGAGDAFNGGFAVALAEGMDPVASVRFGCATAGISVTRAGAAPSMPSRAEINAVLARYPPA